LIKEISEIRNVLNVTQKENTLNISAKDGSGTLPEIVSVFERTGRSIRSISIRSPSLEDVFIHFTGKHFGEGEERRRSQEEKG
jgi:ABC-2 type transport system ATP-binding protein